MSFDRPGLPEPGRPADQVEAEEILEEEGVDVTDGRLDGRDHPGGPSAGPQPNPPRRPHPPEPPDHQPT
ncbi:hypothetical protein ACQPXM_03995 [Kribbella sp. CA-253562]|uniref:hypothetical protein n=1 Tax=Kribbella sp. CA-253562 TaxID=3239942 RepID=UPI003D938583